MSAATAEVLNFRPLEGWSFLEWVWARTQAEARGWSVYKYRTLDGKWYNKWFSAETLDHWALNEVFPENCDIYFSPVSYSRPRAKKEFALPCCWLFLDLDYSDPADLPLKPTVGWETSEGKYQALWLMQRAVEPEEHRHLNRALSHACGADPGTWNINRLLRVPGTPNMKAFRRG